MQTIISEEKLEALKSDIVRMLKTLADSDKELNPATLKMLINEYEEIQICQKVILKYGTVENN